MTRSSQKCLVPQLHAAILLVAHWARGMIAANLYCYIPGSFFMSLRRLSQISESGILKEKHAVAILSEKARMLKYTGR